MTRCREGASIKRDRFGIPHISGENYADVAYGYGYAIAQDNICVLADPYVTVDAERSRYFGPASSCSRTRSCRSLSGSG